MTHHRCTCGHQAGSPEGLFIHLGEMFIPATDLAPDGQPHAESARDPEAPVPSTLTCLCGYASDLDGIDQHLVDVFTPANHLGLDGHHHAPAPTAERDTVPADGT